MMLPLRLWLRRSTALLAFPAMVAIVFLVVFSRSGWSWERSQAVSWSTSSTILLGPLAAGLVAFDLWRRQTPTMQELTRSTHRGALGVLTIAVASWLLAVLAWLLGVAVALGMAAGNGADGLIPWWVVAQGLVSMLACVLLGAMTGTALKNVAAAPLAAMVCYLIPIAAASMGAQGIMTAGGATAPLIGITQDHVIALTVVVVTALLAATCWQLVRRLSVPTGVLTTTSAVALGITLVGSGIYLNSLSPMTSTMRPSSSPEVCEGDVPEVCGPAEGRALYALAADDLAEASRQLARDGVVGVERYDYPRGNVPLPPQGAGMLSLSPSEITDGHLAPWDIALTLATPAVCPAYYGDAPPHDLLNAQGSLAAWIVDRLAGTGGRSAVDVEAARATLSALKSCEGGAAPSWDYTG